MVPRRPRRRAAARAALLCLTILWAAIPARIRSQSGGELRTIEGRVVRPALRGEGPVGSQLVTLHRIATDSAGVIDSVMSGRDGSYHFSYRARAAALSDNTMYIASTRYAGVVYFTPPLRGVDVRGPDAEIVVFDTTSRPIPLTVRGRHLVVSGPEKGGSRHVVEVFEIANDTSVTRIAGATGETWSTALPAGAQSAQVTQGDIPAGAVRLDGGRARVMAPISPGIKQLVVTYDVPARAFPLAVREAGADVLEVLLAEPDAHPSTGGPAGAPGGLVRQPSVTLDSVTYARFLGRDVPRDAVLRVTVPATGYGSALTVALLLAAAAAMVAGIWWGRHRMLPAAVGGVPRAPGASVVASETPAALANAIAALDAVRATATSAAQAAYSERRAELKARLIAILPSSAHESAANDSVARDSNAG